MNKNEALKEAKDLFTRFDNLHPTLNTLVSKHDTDVNDLYDKLSLLVEQLTGLCDGRPTPIDFSARFEGLSDELTPNGMHSWAVCTAPGFEEKVFIGGVSLNLADTLKVRDWLNSAIEFHEASPSKPNE